MSAPHAWWADEVSLRARSAQDAAYDDKVFSTLVAVLEGDKVGAAIVGGPPAILLTRRARGGAAASPAEYQVALLSRPDGPVTVDIVLPPLAQRAVEVVGSSVLSFDASDWAKPQSVWLRAVPLRAGEEAAAAAAARCRTNDHGIAVACEPEQVVVQHALRDNRGGLVAAAEPAERAARRHRGLARCARPT
jgi:hypothetical protein